MKFQLAIDGPSASGKSTISKLLAKKLNWNHIDTGALYRTVALNALITNKDTNNQEDFNDTKNLNIKYIDGKIYLNDKDVTNDIRTNELSRLSSLISSYPSVRKGLYDLQVKLSNIGCVIMDGRDIGTNIMKNADLKIYLTASLDCRAKRRLEDEKNTETKTLEEIKDSIKKRDSFDKARKMNPLCQADDAVLLDSTDLSIDQVLEKIIKLINNKIKENKENERKK